ncbi:Cytochrome c551 peroxidase [Cupriavidus yeoncheonensis]|uniref:Cytochrome c551 peroxidase n=1 Tax=Cupriavidus yeoncheonensis TaxID=1462994 RepID=A0A916J062_9BURK|nr:cytochrome c peroxidase [Cupriavidus yeoncheonensis]CAG2157177.1 Cytochrome c551 peroxidase [Cupriavidus yeoncheonensis]
MKALGIRAGMALAGVPVAMAIAAGAATPAALRDAWVPEDLQTLTAMQLTQAGPRPVDPSNIHERSSNAASLGRALFNDPRLSRNGRVSCASCHAPAAQFEDGRPVGQGIGTGKRRTMPVMGAAGAPFLFWDGRKDSLWSQALGPMEDAAEHGGNRMRFARIMRAHYATQYEQVFGPLPAMPALARDASPLGTRDERAAWAALPPATQQQVNRVFANMGKAIAAYESRVRYGPSRFDRYVGATLAADPRGQDVLSVQEVRGLRLFLGKGQCITCHNGPMLSDHAFHNTGVPPLDPARPDRGRADAVPKLLRDEFNCLGPYSDAKPEQCGELNFLAQNDPAHLGAFRTPSLRNVADRAPYMHAGQIKTLQEVVRHYGEAPDAMVGHSELARPGDAPGHGQLIRLSPQDVEDLVAFLGTLSGAVDQPR